jgi:hypothetical protein
MKPRKGMRNVLIHAYMDLDINRHQQDQPATPGRSQSGCIESFPGLHHPFSKVGVAGIGADYDVNRTPQDLLEPDLQVEVSVKVKVGEVGRGLELGENLDTVGVEVKRVTHRRAEQVEPTHA